MNQTITTPPSKVKPPEIFMIGGGQKETTADDLAPITFSIRCNVECKNDEREVTACVPIYEHCLLKMMWSRTGGAARFVTDWLPSAAKYPRVVKLSRDNLRDEVTRLSATYKIHNPNGSVTNYFKETYGRDGDPVRGFYKVINEQVRAWRRLEDKIRGGHRLASEDLIAISDIARPPVSLESPDMVSNFGDITVDSDQLAAPAVDGNFEEDPLDGLRSFLFEREWDSEVVMDLMKIMGDGEKITPIKVGTLPSLHGKKSEQSKLVSDYKAFLASEEKKLAAKDARKAESVITTTV